MGTFVVKVPDQIFQLIRGILYLDIKMEIHLRATDFYQYFQIVGLISIYRIQISRSAGNTTPASDSMTRDLLRAAWEDIGSVVTVLYTASSCLGDCHDPKTQ